MHPTANILVVEDEPRYMRAIRINLEASGYTVYTAATGREALEAVAQHAPDLVLLDLLLPEIDGFTVCRRLREFSEVPVIMLTARTETEDVVKGLDCGADDYVTKPFSAKELLARVRAALRRSQAQSQRAIETAFSTPDGRLRVDFTEQRVFVAEEEVRLTLTEYRLLSLLIHNANRVLVSDYLLEQIWGTQHEDDNRLLWQAIHRLRQKIRDEAKENPYIQTRPGIGYVFLCEK